MRNFLSPVASLALLWGLASGCNPVKDIGIATAAVDDFHRQAAAQQDDAIYAGATDRFRTATTQNSWHGMLSRIRRKLGACVEFKTTGWLVSVNTSGYHVTLNSHCECAQGPLDERFVWTVEGNQAKLDEYTVQSPVLATD